MAASGRYRLASPDGGSFEATCDMETFGGGWTLVTPDMIVFEATSQDIDSTSASRVEVARSTDARGGIAFDVKVTAINCGASPGKVGPRHTFRVRDLDGAKEILATYTFAGTADCWNILGDTKYLVVPSMANVRRFDLALDRIDRQQNMARTDAGAALPYDGQTSRCDVEPDNFWTPPYQADTKTARVTLRRDNPLLDMGVDVGVDCSSDSRWFVSEIFVR